MSLATVTEAVTWLKEHWDEQRPVPIRLHTGDQTPTSPTRDRRGCACLGCRSDGHAFPAGIGAPDFHGQFLAVLDSGAGMVERVAVWVSCSHPQRVNGLCTICVLRDEDGTAIAETGQYQKNVERFRFPMSRALAKLARAKADPGQPHPYAVVRAVPEVGWRWQTLRLGEAVVLRSIRRLEGRYESQPPTNWTEKSESQRAAEGAAVA